MDQIISLVELLKDEVPGLEIEIDRPDSKNGESMLDLRAGERHLVIGYNARTHEFGVYAEDAGFGERPETTHTEEDELVKHIKSFFA